MRRGLIRNTYGSFKRLSKQNTIIVFIVGEVVNDTLQEEIVKENQNYRDIIQANFLDSYKNLTLKHIALLNWVSSFCNTTKHFIKVDDDTMVDIFHLVYFLETYPTDTDYLCKVVLNTVNRVGKWAVTKDEYKKDLYPIYCEGFAYIFNSPKRLPEMVQESLKIKHFWIDDIAITGFVRQKMSLKFTYFPNNFGFTDISIVTEIDIPNFIFFRNQGNSVDVKLWYNIWKMMLRNTYELYIYNY